MILRCSSSAPRPITLVAALTANDSVLFAFAQDRSGLQRVGRPKRTSLSDFLIFVVAGRLMVLSFLQYLLGSLATTMFSHGIYICYVTVDRSSVSLMSTFN